MNFITNIIILQARQKVNSTMVDAVANITMKAITNMISILYTL
jgi:hypothetical protein